MIKVGDIVVYPAHGVAEIEAIEEREISGTKMPFFILKILDSEMTVMIPVSNVNNVGIRSLVDEKGIIKVVGILHKKDVTIDNQTWNRRYREYMDKIKSGSLFEIAEVLRDLSVLKRSKDLSFGERKMYDTAKNLLLNEISISKGIEKSEVEKMIIEAISKNKPSLIGKVMVI
ncbi:MAG: CarD family transcriptional regulator [Thermodesulfobacteriota bacterium]|nr:CarD family transcriptional regulator [Thermodesulfobacteriota bacterium]